jgi:hypothetical protein
VTRVIAEHDIPVSVETLSLVYTIAALIMVAVAIVVVAWLASVVARLLKWRHGHRERRG